MGQCAEANEQTGVCPASFLGFHYVCTPMTLSDARLYCQSMRMQLAVVNDRNAGGASQTQQWCDMGNPQIWIDSYNGLAGSPCMYQVYDGFAYSGSSFECLTVELPFLCQEIPRLTSVLSTTTTRTIYTGVDIVTTTCAPTRSCVDKAADVSYAAGQEQQQQVLLQEEAEMALEMQEMEQQPDFIPAPRPCSNACGVDSSRFLRVVKELVPYNQAAAVCRKHGWKLADLTYGMARQFEDLIVGCGDPTGQTNLWVRSWEGVDGASCVFGTWSPALRESNAGATGGFGYSLSSCNNYVGPLYPLCDIRCQWWPTGTGAALGTSTTFTSQLKRTESTTVAISTETVTVTSFVKQSPSKPRCCSLAP